MPTKGSERPAEKYEINDLVDREIKRSRGLCFLSEKTHQFYSATSFFLEHGWIAEQNEWKIS